MKTVEVISPYITLEEIPEQIRKEYLLRLICNVPPEIINTRYVTRGMTTESCSWTHSWWARCITKLYHTKYFKWMIPYPLYCLATATEVTYGPKTITFPEAVYDNVLLQIHYLRHQGKEPEAVIIGRKALDDLVINANHFSVMIPPRCDETFNYKILGYNCIVTDRISPNSVLVI